MISHFQFREDLDAPRKTIARPNPTPRINPNLTLLISNPSNNPSTIAKINAISPLLKLGFLSVFIKGLAPNPSLSLLRQTADRNDERGLKSFFLI